MRERFRLRTARKQISGKLSIKSWRSSVVVSGGPERPLIIFHKTSWSWEVIPKCQNEKFPPSRLDLFDVCGTQGSFGEREGMFGKLDWRLDSPCRLPSLTGVPTNPRQSGEEQSFSSPYCTCFYREETLPVDCKLATASCLFPKLGQNSGWELDLESGRILIGPAKKWKFSSQPCCSKHKSLTGTLQANHCLLPDRDKCTSV